MSAPGDTKLALEVDILYRKYRVTDGLMEPQAQEAVERDGLGDPPAVRAILAKACLLDEWPVGWREEEWEGLARWMTWEDIEYWLGRLLDTSPTNLLIAPLLAAQGHLADVLRAIGPAVHVIPKSGRFSAGKSRCGEILTYLGGGPWLASATVPALKSARKEGPVIVGIDEGDEAERDNPGVKAYLLASHDWDARYLKFSEPGEKGKRQLVEIPYGGPVIITFRKKPWEAVASRAYIMEMEPSKRHGVSDDGDGEGFRRLLGPVAIWLKERCREGLADTDGLWPMKRTHEADFLARLDRVTERAVILRQRGFARSVLLIAEIIGLDMAMVEERLTGVIAEQEVESENATIIEAIESDPLFQLEEVGVEELRLSVQKFLRDRKEFVDLTRNRFAEVLKEMGFSREKGPTWKRIERDGREFMAIFPATWRKGVGVASGMRSAPGVRSTHMEKPQTPQTPQTTIDPAIAPVIGPGEAVLAMSTILREICDGGRSASLDDVLRIAHERGVDSNRAKGVLKRMKAEGDVWEPVAGTYRLTENLR